MATIRIDVNSRDVVVNLREMESRLEPARLLPIFGGVMQASIDETFEQEGYPAGSWRLLHASTLAEQFSRRGQSTTTKAGRQRRPFLRFAAGKKLLQDTGDLRRSILHEIEGNRLTIGTNLIYARIHQEGGVIRAKNAKALRIPLGDGRVIFRQKVTIPARPFLLIKPDDPQKMAEAGEAFVTGGAR